VRRTFLVAVLAILLLGGGAILAVLYFTGPSSPIEPPAQEAPAPERAYVPATTGPTGPTGQAEQRQPPPNLKAPAGIPVAPQPDPRADQMEAERAQKFESTMDAQNRRAQERIRKAQQQRNQGAPAR